MILLLGGNSDGIRIGEALKKEGINFIYSSLYEYGGAGLGVEEVFGALTEDGMDKIIEDKGIRLIIDATHPYARAVSENAIKVSEQLEISYLRYERSESVSTDILSFGSEAEAVEYLMGTKGRILLTTGSNKLMLFSALGPERLIARVLPTSTSLERCEQAGLNYRQIIAETGPFTVEENIRLIEKYRPSYIVLKDSGAAGGTQEKILAAKQTGIIPVVIERPTVNYPNSFSSIEDLLEALKSFRSPQDKSLRFSLK